MSLLPHMQGCPWLVLLSVSSSPPLMPEWLISSAWFDYVLCAWLSWLPLFWKLVWDKHSSSSSTSSSWSFIKDLFNPWALLESWESGTKLKFEQTCRRSASSPPLSSATLECGWADYVCKLVFIHVRVAHFNFQHITSGRAPALAAALRNSDLWWLVNTHKKSCFETRWTWFGRCCKMFFISDARWIKATIRIAILGCFPSLRPDTNKTGGETLWYICIKILQKSRDPIMSSDGWLTLFTASAAWPQRSEQVAISTSAGWWWWQLKNNTSQP